MIVFSHTHKNVLETLFCVLTVSSHVLYMSRGLHSGSMNSTWKVFECLPPVQQYYTTVWFSSIFFDGHAVKDPYHTYVYSSSWRDRIILHSYLDHFLSSNKVKNKSKNNPFIIGLEASRLHVKAFISKAGAFCGETEAGPSRVYPCFRVRAIFEGWVPTENSARAVYSSHTAFLWVKGMGGLEMAVIWNS